MKQPAAFSEQFEQLRGLFKSIDERLARVESQVAALLRRDLLAEQPADPLARIDRGRFAYFSQHEEDGMLYSLFQQVGTQSKSFVEIGCGGNGGNSGFLARECGWSGLMIDAAERAVRKTADRFDPARVRCTTAMVSSKNVNALLAQYDIPAEPDLVSVDIDSTDYWVLEALTTKYRPRVIVAEYNSAYGPTASVTIPDSESFVRVAKGAKHLYYGASLSALVRLAKRRGFRLAFIDPSGTNAVFVRNDLAPDLPAADPVQAFRYYLRHRGMASDVGDVVAFFEQHGLPLVAV